MHCVDDQAVTVLWLFILYLSAAFDNVAYLTLLASLSRLEITETALSWFQSYLAGRREGDCPYLLVLHNLLPRTWDMVCHRDVFLVRFCSLHIPHQLAASATHAVATIIAMQMITSCMPHADPSRILWMTRYSGLIHAAYPHLDAQQLPETKLWKGRGFAGGCASILASLCWEKKCFTSSEISILSKAIFPKVKLAFFDQLLQVAS